MLPWQPFLAFYILGAHWHHLQNTTEPPACGDDAALCQITLTTCLLMHPHPHFTHYICKKSTQKIHKKIHTKKSTQKNPQKNLHLTRFKIRTSTDPHFTDGHTFPHFPFRILPNALCNCVFYQQPATVIITRCQPLSRAGFYARSLTYQVS